MRSSPSGLQINGRNVAFTVVEVLVAAALIGVIGLISFSVLRSGLILSKQNAGINLSSMRARQMIDRIGEATRYSLEQPILINANGAAATGSDADGLLVKRYVAGPYFVKEQSGTNGDIAANATQFMLKFRSDLPAPAVGDWILMETITRPELEISAAVKSTDEDGLQRWLVTTTAAMGELVRPSSYRVSGQLYRKEAFVFVATETGLKPRSELRHYNRVRSATNFSQQANYRVLASGFRKNGAEPYFKNTTSNGMRATVLSALVHSSGRQEYLEESMKTTKFTTIPIEIRLWALSQ